MSGLPGSNPGPSANRARERALAGQICPRLDARSSTRDRCRPALNRSKACIVFHNFPALGSARRRAAAPERHVERRRRGSWSLLLREKARASGALAGAQLRSAGIENQKRPTVTQARCSCASRQRPLTVPLPDANPEASASASRRGLISPFVCRDVGSCCAPDPPFLERQNLFAG
jgi:hypothetical protein